MRQFTAHQLRLSWKIWTLELQNTTNNANTTTQTSEMVLALQSHVTWLIAFFCLCYQGAEVLAGDSYILLDYRHSDANSTGYIASGLWDGLTLGRLLLTRPIHKYIGLRRAFLWFH